MKPSTQGRLVKEMRKISQRFHEKAHWLAEQQSIGNAIGDWDQKDFIEKHHRANVAEYALQIIKGKFDDSA